MKHWYKIIIIMITLICLCSCQKQQDATNEINMTEYTSQNDVSSTESTTYNLENSYSDTESNISDTEEPIWVEDKLYQLAVDELGEDSVENVAADATTVKFLITEPNPQNANLTQYAILYRMKDEYNMTVKFVFYKERSNVSTAYLRNTYTAKTLSELDWDNLSILDIESYAE